MTGALIILAVTVAIGVLLWAWEKFRSERHGNSLHHHGAVGEGSRVKSQEPSAVGEGSRVKSQEPGAVGEGSIVKDQEPSVCCGLHAICEKTGQINEPPVYYDDEELDRFAGRAADAYTDQETEEFRDVLLTLLPSDAPGWSISLEKRRINLPQELQPELELLLSEA